jgi:hypothetical protein
LNDDTENLVIEILRKFQGNDAIARKTQEQGRRPLSS